MSSNESALILSYSLYLSLIACFSSFNIGFLVFNTIYFFLLVTFLWKRQKSHFDQIYHESQFQKNYIKKDLFAGVEVEKASPLAIRIESIFELIKNKRKIRFIIFPGLCLALYNMTNFYLFGLNLSPSMAAINSLIVFLCLIQVWGGFVLMNFVSFIYFVLLNASESTIQYLITICVSALFLFNLHSLNSWYYQYLIRKKFNLNMLSAIKSLAPLLILFLTLYMGTDKLINEKKSLVDQLLAKVMKSTLLDKKSSQSPEDSSFKEFQIKMPKLGNNSVEQLLEIQKNHNYSRYLEQLNLSEVNSDDIEIANLFKKLENKKTSIQIDLNQEESQINFEKISNDLAEYDQLNQDLISKLKQKGVKNIDLDQSAMSFTSGVEKLDQKITHIKSKQEKIKKLNKKLLELDEKTDLPYLEKISQIESLQDDLAEIGEQGLIEKLESEKKTILDQEVAKRDNKLKDKLKVVILILFAFIIIFFISRAMSRKQILYEDEISNELKDEIKKELNKFQYKFDNFEHEVREKYRFFHNIMEKLYFEDKAPPAIAMSKALEEENAYKKIASNMAIVFTKSEFMEVSKFSTKYKRIFRRDFKNFEKTLRRSLR